MIFTLTLFKKTNRYCVEKRNFVNKVLRPPLPSLVLRVALLATRKTTQIYPLVESQVQVTSDVPKIVFLFSGKENRKNMTGVLHHEQSKSITKNLFRSSIISRIICFYPIYY